MSDKKLKSARDIAREICPTRYLSLLQAANQAALRLYGNDHNGTLRVMELLVAGDDLLADDELRDPDSIIEFVRRL